MKSREDKPLSALLAQTLVAYTIELDNEFELRMAGEGFPGARLSLFVWTNVLRFLPDDGISIQELVTRSGIPSHRVKNILGCLERWGFVSLKEKADPITTFQSRREGWGSGRGIGVKWKVKLTNKGKVAVKIWPRLWDEIDERWSERFRDFVRIRQLLQGVANKIQLKLPWGVPPSLGMDEGSYLFETGPVETDSHLSTLLSQVLLDFILEFNRQCRTPLDLCAGVVRVLGEGPLPYSELPRLTGESPEASNIGWRLKPYVVVEANRSGKRGKTVRLSPRGLQAKDNYYRIAAAIEQDFKAKYGADVIRALRASLENLLKEKKGNEFLVSEALFPPKGISRAGEAAPALGRRDLGVAALQRTRDLAEQTRIFIENPAESLPHYPAWDFNRGFGP
jgi:hypothetical protein